MLPLALSLFKPYSLLAQAGPSLAPFRRLGTWAPLLGDGGYFATQPFCSAEWRKGGFGPPFYAILTMPTLPWGHIPLGIPVWLGEVKVIPKLTQHLLNPRDSAFNLYLIGT